MKIRSIRVGKKEGKRGTKSDMYLLKCVNSFINQRNRRLSRTSLHKVSERTEEVRRVWYQSSIKSEKRKIVCGERIRRYIRLLSSTSRKTRWRNKVRKPYDWNKRQ